MLSTWTPSYSASRLDLANQETSSILGASRRVVLQDSETPPTRRNRKTQKLLESGVLNNR
jgi:hypothetical protein